MKRPELDPAGLPRAPHHITRRQTELQLRKVPDLTGARAMAIGPHPDDETTFVGATLRDLAERGALTSVVTCTDGSAATIFGKGMDTAENYRNQGVLRSAELDRACEALGVTEWEWLGHVDSGMPGEPRSHHPMAYVNLPDDVVVAELVTAIRRFQPHIVFTDPPDGNYQHPDHIASHRRAARAIAEAADATLHPDAGPPWQVSKVYYTGFAQSSANRAIAYAAQAGLENPSRKGAPHSGLFTQAKPDAEMTTFVDATSGWSWVKEAIRAHASQMPPGWPPLAWGDPIDKLTFGHETFRLAAALGGISTSFPETEVCAGLKFGLGDHYRFNQERKRLAGLDPTQREVA